MPEDSAVTTVPTDTPPLEVSPSVLEKLEPREYNAIRDAQEFEKKHPEPDEPEETGTEKQHQPRRKSGWERRVDKLTRRAHEAERRAAEAEAKLAGNGARQHPESTTAGKSIESASTQRAITKTDPRREAAAKRYPDFEETLKSADNTVISPQLKAAIEKTRNPYDIVYYLQKNPDALLSLDRAPHEVAEFSRKLEEIHDSFNGRTERLNQLRVDHSQRIKARLATLPDRDKVIAGLNAPMPRYIETAILEQGNSDDLVIHFGRNRSIYDELNRMSPEAAAARIGKISHQLEMQASSQTRERVKPPEPISTVGGTSARSSIPMDELPMKEFIKVRNQQERARRR